MKEKKSCIPAILSFLLVLGAIAAVAFVVYKKFCKKKPELQDEEESDLLEADEATEDSDVEDLSEIDGGEEV